MRKFVQSSLAPCQVQNVPRTSSCKRSHCHLLFVTNSCFPFVQGFRWSLRPWAPSLRLTSFPSQGRVFRAEDSPGSSHPYTGWQVVSLLWVNEVILFSSVCSNGVIVVNISHHFCPGLTVNMRLSDVTHNAPGYCAFWAPMSAFHRFNLVCVIHW